MTTRRFQPFLLAVLLALHFFFSAVRIWTFVNPVQWGDAGVLASNLAKTVRSIAAAHGGTWVVDGEMLPMNQYPMLCGAPTVNAGNTYPFLERWMDVDPEGKAAKTWNRYVVSIRFNVKPDGEPFFSLLCPDSFQIDAPMHLLRRWNVRWVLSRRRGLQGLSGGGLWLRRAAKASGWYIFAVEPGPKTESDAGPTTGT